MARVIINGKWTNVPDSASDADIIRAGGKRNVDPSTRTVLKRGAAGKGNDRMKPGMKYRVRDGEKYTIVPDRVKALDFFESLGLFFSNHQQSNFFGDGRAVTYFGNKEPWRKQLIEEQVLELSAKMFKGSPVELDEDCNYVVFSGFLLPEEWQNANPGVSFVKMMLIFPDQYPDLPTNGFYLPADLQVPQNAAHFYNRGYGGAFGENAEEQEFMARGNWKWYCTHIKPNAWQPARLRQISDWRHGDNLWDIVSLCKDVLTHPLDD